ncbi:MAG: 2-succinyl-6-hydroxy-2,4-cyclohexadiene-1-carboxylate synthase [Ignavibacteriales bacterium]|nr:MAG: 2-succinyl-6-hydroxy-2,4-cyclohexadiene-1-carboxylate synthase [Ignavibacteriales bacterium]
MIIALSDININVTLYPFSGDDNFVFLLHGFTGSGKDWDTIIKELDQRFNYVTVDLPGHGLSESPEDVNRYSPDALVSQLNELIVHFTKGKIILVGYSMGGRAALLYSTRNRQKIKGLIVEGATAGIKEDKLRKLRKADDENLARFIENHTMEEFLDQWMNLDIFKSQKKIPRKLKTLREEKMINNKKGLANSLRGFSTGNMPPLFNDLCELQFKTLLITGELDKKYKKLNSEMAAMIPYCRHMVVPGAGHNVHVEKPERFISAVNEFLDSY